MSEFAFGKIVYDPRTKQSWCYVYPDDLVEPDPQTADETDSEE